MAGIVGHKMHVFAIPGHFYGEYPDGGTLGYELSLRGPAPKAEKKTIFMRSTPFSCLKITVSLIYSSAGNVINTVVPIYGRLV